MSNRYRDNTRCSKRGVIQSGLTKSVIEAALFEP